MSVTDCVFCDIIDGRTDADIVRVWDDAIAIVPLDPVIDDGHLTVIPHTHVRDMLDDPDVSGLVARRAAELGRDMGWEHGNYGVNIGEHGAQTIWHVHGHLLRADDTVQHMMPWFGQKLRGERRFFVGPDGDGDLTLWTGSGEHPLPVAARHQLEDMDPILWPLITTVLEPEHLTCTDRRPEAC